jgi:hypothetical protein
MRKRKEMILYLTFKDKCTVGNCFNQIDFAGVRYFQSQYRPKIEWKYSGKDLLLIGRIQLLRGREDHRDRRLR